MVLVLPESKGNFTSTSTWFYSGMSGILNFKTLKTSVFKYFEINNCTETLEIKSGAYTAIWTGTGADIWTGVSGNFSFKTSKTA
jgi:restriction endonuclease S subunit